MIPTCIMLKQTTFFLCFKTVKKDQFLLLIFSFD